MDDAVMPNHQPIEESNHEHLQSRPRRAQQICCCQLLRWRSRRRQSEHRLADPPRRRGQAAVRACGLRLCVRSSTRTLRGAALYPAAPGGVDAGQAKLRMAERAPPKGERRLNADGGGYSSARRGGSDDARQADGGAAPPIDAGNRRLNRLGAARAVPVSTGGPHGQGPSRSGLRHVRDRPQTASSSPACWARRPPRSASRSHWPADGHDLNRRLAGLARDDVIRRRNRHAGRGGRGLAPVEHPRPPPARHPGPPTGSARRCACAADAA
jgi:hypothetical protein